jgi:hypothetical protein
LLILLFANGGILCFTASLAMGVLCGLAVAQSQIASKRDFDLSEIYNALNATNDAPRAVPTMPPVSPAKTGMQFALALFSVALATQAAWILLAERYPASQMRLPTDPKAANVMRLEQDKIKRAASVAVVRGDLWSETAFTFASQLWTEPASLTDGNDRSSADVQKSLTQALRYSPHRGDVWLLFAALADRYKWARYQPGLLLKMSYYTAPNELALLPMRLNVLLHVSGAIGDAELQEMARRDISLILTRAPGLKPTLVDAYRSASPAGKAFAERVISEVDPGYLSIARAGFP